MSRHYKRAGDIVLALFFALVFAPVFLLICLLIKLGSRGPVLFVQMRPGQFGRTFRIYKFRTMRTTGFNGSLGNLDDEDRMEFERRGKVQADPRVTRIGRLLRRTSLDELPQLWNILIGDMSFVGPRPYLREQMMRVGRQRERILQVRPGLTGLWQVSGRNDLEFRRRLAIDRWYVRHGNFLCDMSIVCRTVWVVLTGRGAY